MSYLVLARKYRPQTFADMIGQEHVVRTLENAIERDRVAHAFLFTGARGVGKTSGARILAKALNCESGPTTTPCGKCAPCLDIAASQSVDVQEIDGASNNGVDQVRELRENARYLPSRDRHKLYIIDEVHMLTGAAFNALLKTLEEPPDHVKFIFATTEPHKIPLTILSRTQRFDFRRIPLVRIVERIGQILEAEGIRMSEAARALVARQAEGSMRDALSLLDQVTSAGGEEIPDTLVEEVLGVIDRTLVARVAGALIDGDAAAALDGVAQVFDRGLDLARLAEDLAWHLRNVMVLQVGGEALRLLDVADHEREELEAQAARSDGATLSFLFDVVHRAIPEVGRATQPRLALEVALLKAIQLAPGADVHTLLERVEALSAGQPVPTGRRGPASGGGGGRAQPPAARAASPKPARKTAPSGDTPAPARAAPPKAAAPSGDTPAPARAAPPKAATPSGPPEPPAPPPDLGDFGGRAARMAAKAKAQGLTGASAVDASTRGSAPPEPPPPTDADAPPPEAGAGPAPAANGSAGPSRRPDPAPAARSASKSKPRSTRPATPSPSAASGGRTPEAGTPETGGDIPRLQPGDDPSATLAERFEVLVNAVMQLAGRPFVAAALEHARPMEIGDSSLTVALPRGLYHDGLGSPANRRVLESLLSDHFGRPMQIRLEVAEAVKLDGLPEAIAARKERELLEHAERVRQEALDNPAVRLAVETLDGEIEDIRILKD